MTKLEEVKEVLYNKEASLVVAYAGRRDKRLLPK